MAKVKLPKTQGEWVELLSRAWTVASAALAFWKWGRSKAYWDKTNGPGGFDGGMHGPTK